MISTVKNTIVTQIQNTVLKKKKQKQYKYMHNTI
jgi:hypothetical protein